MQITVELPDDVAGQLGEVSTISRQLVEAFATERYRQGKLSRNQVGRLLGLDYWQTEELLTRHDAKRPYTLEDLEIDRASLAGLEKP